MYFLWHGHKASTSQPDQLAHSVKIRFKCCTANWLDILVAPCRTTRHHRSVYMQPTSATVVHEEPAIQQNREILERRSNRCLSCKLQHKLKLSNHALNKSSVFKIKQHNTFKVKLHQSYLVDASSPSPHNLIKKQKSSHQRIFCLAKHKTHKKKRVISLDPLTATLQQRMQVLLESLKLCLLVLKIISIITFNNWRC